MLPLVVRVGEANQEAGAATRNGSPVDYKAPSGIVVEVYWAGKRTPTLFDVFVPLSVRLPVKFVMVLVSNQMP